MLMQDAFDRYNLNGYFRSLLVLPIGEVYYDRIRIEDLIGTYFIPFSDDEVELTMPPLHYRIYLGLVDNDGHPRIQEWDMIEIYLDWYQMYFGVYEK